MKKKYFLGLMTEEEAREAFQQRSVAILPIGSLEQHGPHLPAATDAIIAEGISFEIAKAIKAIVLPSISYGNSFSWSRGWISTITLAQGRLADLVYDIGKAVAEKGCKYYLIFNGHGSNPPDIVIGSKLLKEKFPDLDILLVEWWSAGASAISENKESQAESHSGEFETSIMLYLAPDLVYLDRMVTEFASTLPDLCYQYLIVKGSGDKIKRIQFYGPEISVSGVYGDPSKSSAEKGAQVVKRVVDNVQQLIQELSNER